MEHPPALFAFAALSGLTALAQTLPKLVVAPALNRTNWMVNITWPYTNAGFALQEATNLGAWRSSALTPAFDPNRAAFAASAAATNSAEFFRLLRPADLSGIYIYSVLAFTNAIRQAHSELFKIP